MSKQKQLPAPANVFSRRAFLKASAVAGGGAAAFLGGLRPSLAREGATSKVVAALLPEDSASIAQEESLAARLAASGTGKVYYVDGVIGDDHYTGTLPTVATTDSIGPFKTIQRGVDVLQAGDVLFVREGTYHEQVTIATSGQEGKYVVVAAFPGERPVIDGCAGVAAPNSGLPDGFPGCEAKLTEVSKFGTGYRETGLVHIKADYVLLEGFVITRSMGRGLLVSKDRPGFNPCLDADEKSNRKTPRGVTHDVIIRNCEISYSRHVGLLLESCGKNEVEPDGPYPDIVGCTIEGCEVHRSGNFAPFARESRELNWPGALTLKECLNISVYASKVHENWGEGIMGDPQDNGTRLVRIIGNECWDNYRASVYVHGAQDVRIERNLMYHSNDEEFPSSQGISVRPTEDNFDNIAAKNITIMNNIIVGFGTNINFNATTGREIVNTRVWFNTIIDGQDNNLNNNSEGDNKNCDLTNNIIYHFDPAKMIREDFKTDGWHFGGNLWSHYPPEQFFTKDFPSDGGLPFDGVGGARMVSHRAPRPRGCADPNWYRIQNFSNALARARPLPTPDDGSWLDVDYFCRTRPVEVRPSMGAHQWREGHDFDVTWSEWEPLHDVPFYFNACSVARNKQYRIKWRWDTKEWKGPDLTTEEAHLEILALGDLGNIGAVWRAGQREPGKWNKNWWHLIAFDPYGYGVFKELVAARNRSDDWALDGRVDLFALRQDGFVFRSRQSPPDLSKELQPPSVPKEPQKAASRNWVRHHFGWSDWEPFYDYPKQFVSLVAAENLDGKLALFGLDTDQQVWLTDQEDPGNWRGSWELMHDKDNAFMKLAVSRNYKSCLELFGIKADGSIWHTWQLQPSGDWNGNGWRPMPANKESPGLPWQSFSVGLNSGNELEVFAVAADNTPWHIWHRPATPATQKGWSSWTRFFTAEQRYFRELIATRDKQGKVFSVLGLATDGTSWYTARQKSGDWSPWDRLHGRKDRFEKLVTMANKDDLQEVFGLKSDGSIWRLSQLPMPKDQNRASV